MSVEILELEFPAPRWAEPLLGVARYKGAKGGRGGGKGYFFADRLIRDCIVNPGTLACCLREVQLTLQESSKRLIEKRMHHFGVTDQFSLYKDVIETPGDGLIIFRGMQSYNSENIKSLEGYNRFWWDEAQNASATSIELLRPTVREKGAEIHFSWNPDEAPDPEHPFSSVDGLFGLHIDDPFKRMAHIASMPGGGALVHVNFNQNPWFDETSLVDEEKWDKLNRAPEDYAHVWGGAYRTNSEARVFHNYHIENFETPANHRDMIFMFGGDWGYAVDPSVLVRAWTARKEGEVYIPDVNGRFLMIDQEAYRVGCEIDYTPALFAGNKVAYPGNPWKNENPHIFEGIEGATEWEITADSARPETISYLQKHGLPRIVAAIKGPNSVQEGVEFIRTFTVVIHTRCKHTADEFTFYSFKVDPKTKVILPILQDKKNHVIDSVRYLLEKRRRARGFFG
jgi:phage terminase large subunit